MATTVGGVFKTIGRVAYPFITLAAQAGGPLGAMAAKSLGTVLGEDIANTPEAIENAMGKAILDPATQAAMAKAEQDFQLQMATITNGRIKDADDFEAHLQQIAADDRANARDREIKVGDKTTRNLAYIYAIAFFLTIVAEIWMTVSGRTLNELAMKSVDILLGAEIGMVLGTKEYYFGSSSGSAAKSETLDKVITAQGDK